MDLTRLELIRDSSIEELQSAQYLEKLMEKLGFNTEGLEEQPEIVKANGGGLLVWQYPNQFSKYLCLLSQHKIESYMEIGCRWGGTFVLTVEYLKRFNATVSGVAVDLIDSPVAEYCGRSSGSQFLKMNSQSPEFKGYMASRHFDLIFIDGDHSYSGVKSDYQEAVGHGRIFVFHDIVNDVCPGVIQFWNELKQFEKDTYTFYEFVEQYPDVWNRTRRRYLGIGVAVKK